MSDRGRRRGVLVVGLVAAGGILTALVNGLVTNAASETNWPGPLGLLQRNPWLALLVVGVLAVGLAVTAAVLGVGGRDIGSAPPGDGADPATRSLVAALAVAVRREFDEEIGNRRLNTVIDLGLTRHPADRSGVPVQTLDDLVGVFGGRARRRLVLTGPPGSGKSTCVLRLARSLLVDRGADEPVPLLINLSGWVPGDQHLDDLIGQRIRSYRRSGRRRSSPTAAVDRLVDAGLVLPVLDGLDELPQAVWPDAQRELAKVLGAADRQFVLACGAAMFEALVPPEVVNAADTIVLGIEPVTAGAAVAFLRAGLHSGDTRWEPVFRTLLAEPGSPLARVLDTPLMIYLAQVAYRDPTTRPAGLCDRRALPTVQAVEGHLLHRYLPSLYQPTAARQDTPPETAGLRIRPEQAERWLGFLARFLNRQGTTALMWWQLPAAVPLLDAGLPGRTRSGWRPADAAAAIPGALSTVGGVALSVLGLAWLTRVLIGAGDHLVPDDARPVVDVLAGVADLVQPWVVDWSTEQYLTDGAFLVLAVLVVAVARSAEAPPSEPWTGTARASIASDRLLGVVHGSGAGVLVAAGTVLVCRFQGFWGKLVADVPGFGALATERLDWANSVRIGLLLGGLFGLGGYLTGRRMDFPLAVTVLALGGRLPWRLVDFLEDAHRRGALRRNGVVYEFRHRTVQKYLTNPDGFGIPVADRIETSRALAGRGRFRAAVRELRRIALYEPAARTELARLCERRAVRVARGRLPFREWRSRTQFNEAIGWWHRAVSEGDAGAVLSLSDYYERLLDRSLGWRYLDGLARARWYAPARTFWITQAATADPELRQEIRRVIRRRLALPHPNLLWRLHRETLATEFRRLLEAEGATPEAARMSLWSPPPMQDDPWDGVALSGPVDRALRRAGAAVPPDAVLTTGRLLVALAEEDVYGDWDRLWLHTGFPSLAALAGAPDATCPDPAPTVLVGGEPVAVSADLRRALTIAGRIAHRYRMDPLQPGGLAVALLATPDSGAGRALTAPGDLDHRELVLRAMQDVLGAELPDLDALLTEPAGVTAS